MVVRIIYELQENEKADYKSCDEFRFLVHGGDPNLSLACKEFTLSKVAC